VPVLKRPIMRQKRVSCYEAKETYHEAKET